MWLPLVWNLVGPSLCCRSIRCIIFLSLTNPIHLGDLLNLKRLGSPDRTNDSQYAMSSSENEVSVGVISLRAKVPLGLSCATLRTRYEIEKVSLPWIGTSEHHPILGCMVNSRACGCRITLVEAIRPDGKTSFSISLTQYCLLCDDIVAILRN